MATTTDRAETVVLTHVCLKCNQALPTPPLHVFDGFSSPNPLTFIATYMHDDTRILFHTIADESNDSGTGDGWTRCGPVVPAVIVDSVNELEPDAVQALVRGACARAFDAERGEALYNRFVDLAALSGPHAGRMHRARGNPTLNPDGRERYTEYLCNTCSCLFRYGELPPTAEGGGMIFAGLGDPHVDPPRPSPMVHFCPRGPAPVSTQYVVAVPQGTRCGAPGPNVPPCRRHLHHTGAHVTLVNGRELREWTDAEAEVQIEWWYRRAPRGSSRGDTRVHAFRNVGAHAVAVRTAPHAALARRESVGAPHVPTLRAYRDERGSAFRR